MKIRRKITSSIFLLFLAALCNAQGSWNIGYLPIDSISTIDIGKTVRIDFKTPISSAKGRSLRSYIQMKDTSSIAIDGSLIIVVERRKIHVDHGNYFDQYLECINCRDQEISIYDAKIIEVNQNSISFQLEIESKKNGEASPQRESKLVSINRSRLDGVMYER